MTIELIVQPPFGDDWTDITLDGEDEEPLLNIIGSRLTQIGYTILIEEEDGSSIPLENRSDV